MLNITLIIVCFTNYRRSTGSSSSSRKLVTRPLQGLSGAVQSNVNNYTQKTNREVLKTNRKLRL